MNFPPQSLNSSSLLTQALTAEQIQLDQGPNHSQQQQQPQLQQQQQQQFQQQGNPQFHSSFQQQLSSSVPSNNGTIMGSTMGVPFHPGHKDALNDMTSSDWTTFLASDTFGESSEADMILQADVNEENWGTNARNHFSMPNPSSFMERAERQQKREGPSESLQHQVHLRQQQQVYQLQQQHQLRMQLELASQTQLPQSPAPGVPYSSSPQFNMPMQHQFVSGLGQFPTGHSPASSPLSPGNYGGDDYFTSRQASPGPASSPGSSKIKSRPRPSTASARISQGGIKALFGQSLPKNSRGSLDLKAEAALHQFHAQQGMVSPSLGSNGPKTPPIRKKKTSPRASSAEAQSPEPQSFNATLGAVAESSILGLATPTSEGAPGMTLAERRAAAAAVALNAQRRSSTSEPSPLAPRPIVASTMNLGLDAQAKRFVLPSNVTPGSEGLPVGNPALLPTSSPAPIQIGRVIPRNSSSQARTEEQQRHLDDAMERVDFEDVTVAELKEMLRQRGKHGGGKKADLIKRLQAEIDIIRANRNPSLRSSAASAPVPIGSPSNTLHRTLGNMHIGSPPVNSPLASSPSNVRYTPYAPMGSPGSGAHSPSFTSFNNNGMNIPPGPTPPQSSGSAQASSLPRNIALPGGPRDTGVFPSGSPRMSSLLGSSFISSDGTFHQNPIHPVHRQQAVAPKPASRKSSPSSQTSPAGSGLRNSHSPESNSMGDDGMDQDVQDSTMNETEALYNQLMDKPTHGEDFFNGQSPMQQGAPSPTPSFSSVTSSRYNGHHQSPLGQQAIYTGVDGLMFDDACVPHRPSSADIKRVEDEFLTLSPTSIGGHSMDHHTQQQPSFQQAMQQFGQQPGANPFGDQKQQQQQQPQQQQQASQSMFDFDFPNDGLMQQPPISQEDLDMILLGSQSDASFAKDGFQW
ncbi:hypothetical protein EMPS_00906 [Entomortierella parvispora]|uniref:SAP domain-containing protein n=1 Tax=Entomortierella parvispora TaxID=205924 RepID=A0A9P3LSF6_9FUNG|nr:hypothetical protein EMPS_00906 [Entomortierella parvispora]